MPTDRYVVTVAATSDLTAFAAWREVLARNINRTRASYIILPDGQPREIILHVDFLAESHSEVSKSPTSKREAAAWQTITGSSLISLFWISIDSMLLAAIAAKSSEQQSHLSDSSDLSLSIRKRVAAWLDQQIPSSSARTVIIHVTPAASAIASSLFSLTASSNVSNMVKDVMEQLRHDFPTVHCFSFTPPEQVNAAQTSCERLAGSMHSLLVLQAIGRIRRIEDVAHLHRESCCRASSNAASSENKPHVFADMFLLEEAVARGYASLGLYADAMSHLDVIDAVLVQSAANAVFLGRPHPAVWIEQCLSKPPSHVDCLVLDNQLAFPPAPCLLMLLENGQHSLLETRTELFMRQVAIIAQSFQANGPQTASICCFRIARYALHTARSVSMESRQLGLSSGATPSSQAYVDAFIYLIYSEIREACCWLFGIPCLNNMAMGSLGHYAFRALIRLGHYCGLLGRNTSPNKSETLQAVVELLSMFRHREITGLSSGKSVVVKSSQHLTGLLSCGNISAFTQTCVEMAESLISMFKAAGCPRWAKRVGFELARDIYTPDSSARAASLIDCVGYYLISTGWQSLAEAGLKLLAEAPSQETPESSRLRVWALFHLSALLKCETVGREAKALLTSQQKSTSVLNGQLIFDCSRVEVSSKSSIPELCIVLTSKFPLPLDRCQVIAFRNLSSPSQEEEDLHRLDRNVRLLPLRYLARLGVESVQGDEIELFSNEFSLVSGNNSVSISLKGIPDISISRILLTVEGGLINFECAFCFASTTIPKSPSARQVVRAAPRPSSPTLLLDRPAVNIAAEIFRRFLAVDFAFILPGFLIVDFIQLAEVTVPLTCVKILNPNITSVEPADSQFTPCSKCPPVPTAAVGPFVPLLEETSSTFSFHLEAKLISKEKPLVRLVYRLLLEPSKVQVIQNPSRQHSHRPACIRATLTCRIDAPPSLTHAEVAIVSPPMSLPLESAF